MLIFISEWMSSLLYIQFEAAGKKQVPFFYTGMTLQPAHEPYIMIKIL